MKFFSYTAKHFLLFLRFLVITPYFDNVCLDLYQSDLLLIK